MNDEYFENTKRIQNALQEMRKDNSIKVTQNELAKIANVSRGTINNRGEAILKSLKEIKELRKKDLNKKSNVFPFEESLKQKLKESEQRLKQSEEYRIEMFYQLEEARNKIDLQDRELISKNLVVKELEKENRDLKKKLLWS